MTRRPPLPLPILLGALLLALAPAAPAQPKPATGATAGGTTVQASGPGGVAIGQMSGGSVQVGLDAEQVRRLVTASGKEQERLLRELVAQITRQLNQQAAASAQASQAAQAQSHSAGYTEATVQFFFQLMLGKAVPQAEWQKTFAELVQRDKDLQARIAETREATPAASSRIAQLLDQAEAARRAGQPDVAERRLEEADRLASADAQAQTDRARDANRRAAGVRLTRATAAFAQLERERGAELLQAAFDQRADDVTVGTLWWLIRAGDEWRVAGKSARALLAYQRAQRSANAMAALQPEDRGWQREQSVCHNRIGDVLRAQGDGPGALKSYQAGLAIAQSLAAADPRNTEWQRDLSVSHDRIGDVLRAQGDGPGALKSYQAGLAIAQTLAAADPRNTGWQRDLSVSHNKIGNLQRAQGDLAGALTSFRADLAIAERLAQMDRSNAEWQVDVAISCLTLLRLEAPQVPLTEKRGWLTQGLGVLERLQRENRLPAPQQAWPAAFRKALAELDGAAAR